MFVFPRLLALVNSWITGSRKRRKRSDNEAFVESLLGAGSKHMREKRSTEALCNASIVFRDLFHCYNVSGEKDLTI